MIEITEIGVLVDIVAADCVKQSVYIGKKQSLHIDHSEEVTLVLFELDGRYLLDLESFLQDIAYGWKSNEIGFAADENFCDFNGVLERDGSKRL